MKRLIRILPLLGVFCFAAILSLPEMCQAAGRGGLGGRPGAGGGGWHVGGPQGGNRSRHGYGYYGGWDGGYDSWATLYRMGHIPIPPYFALHPPVYYSQPVARTYGYSPYAYPGWVLTPDIVESVPEPIINPHVGPPAEGASAKTASAPKVTYNPFVKSSRGARAENLAQVLSP